MSDLSAPCPLCAQGRHDECRSSLCGCLADHADDDQMMRGFKTLKRKLHPERETQVAGGWARPLSRGEINVVRVRPPDGER